MKRTNQTRRTLITAAIALALAALASCTNPLVVDMQNRITEDVTTFLVGGAPLVTAASPSVSAVDVPTSTTIEATFSIGIDPDTLTAQSIKLLLLPGLTPVAGSVSYDAALRTVRFVPDARLDVERTYRLVVDGSVKSAQGASLGSTFTAQFTTRWFHDDEIGIDLVYSSPDFALNAGSPIYFQVVRYPLPWPMESTSFTLLTESPVTSSGKYRIPQSAIPGGADSALLIMTHEVGDETGETERFVKLGAPGNAVEDAEDIFILNAYGRPLVAYTDGTPVPVHTSGEDIGTPIVEELTGPAWHVLNEAYAVPVGTGHTVQYVDGSNFGPDEFEPGGSENSSHGPVLTQGFYETRRNLHVGTDIDFVRFTPATTDSYEIRLTTTSLQLAGELRNSVGTTIASGSGNGEWVLNPGGTMLTGGQEYHVRLSSPNSGIGSYEIGYFFAVADSDVYESNNSIGTATPLQLGRSFTQTHTFHEEGWGDSDWFAIELTSGNTYVVEVKEDASYFAFSAEARGLTVNFRLEWSDGSSTGIYYPLSPGSNTLFIDNPDKWWGGSGWPDGSNGTGTFYLKIENATPMVGDQRPTMQYSVLLTWGPDPGDQVDHPNLDGNQYDQFNEHGPNGVEGTGYAVQFAGLGTDGRVRTIYSVESGQDPQDDVDWIAFSVYDIYDYYLIRVEPEDGPEAVTVDFTIYKSKMVGDAILPDTSAPVPGGGGSPWFSDNSVRGAELYPFQARGFEAGYADVTNPTAAELRYWIRVSRDAGWPENPLTGRYRVTVQAGPDWQDSYYAGPSETDTVVQMINASGTIFYTGGIDETPYLGVRNQSVAPGSSANFSDRNQLTWSGSPGNYEIKTVWNSIYRRNYQSVGEPDGVTDASADHEFFWFQMPSFPTSFLILLYSNTTPEISLRLTYWELTPAQFSSLSSDQVITEDELTATTAPTVLNSQYLTDESAEKLEQRVTVAGLTNYVFLKVQRDNSRTTYTTSDGTERQYAATGQYRLLIWD